MGLKEGAVRGGVRNVSTGIATIPDTPVNHYTMESGSGSTLVDEYSNKNGTVNGNVTWTTMSKNGTYATESPGGANSDYVDFGSAFMSPPWTAFIWIYPTDGSTSIQRIFGDRSTYNFYLGNDSGTLRFSDNGDYIGETSLSINQWQSAAVTVNSSLDDLRVYYNGSEVGSKTTSLNLTAGSNGRNDFLFAEVYGNPYSGRLDDYIRYDRVLSASEIADLHNATV